MHLTFRTAPLVLLLACNADSGASTGDPSTGDPTTGEHGTTTASSPTSTGEPDPTTTTATTAAPLPGCTELPLCEDFESTAANGPPDPALWTVASPNCSGIGTLAISDEQAHSGAHSLRVDGGGGYCDHIFVAHSAVIAGLGPRVYGRFWVRLDAALGQGHVTFMTLRDSADAGGKDLRMGGQAEIFMWNRESDDATLPSLSPAGIALSLAPNPQQWTCVEFMIDQDTPELRTWIDGDEVTGLVVDAEPTPDVDQQWHGKADWKPVLEDIKLGWESYAGQTMRIYFDDIALASTRIACD